MIRLAGRFLHLLPQKIKRRQLVPAFFVDIKIDIVTRGICGPESKSATRLECLFKNNLVEQFLRVIKKFARLFANYRIVENRRITSAQFPSVKEGRPIDVAR